MTGKTLSLPGMTAPKSGARQPQDSRASRFDPPRYFTTIHVAGYNVLTSIAAARRRHDRRRKSQAFRAAVGGAPAEPQLDAVARAEPGCAGPLPAGREPHAAGAGR